MSLLLADPIFVNSEHIQEDDVVDDCQGFGVRLENSVVLSKLDSHQHVNERGRDESDTKIPFSLF